MPPGVSPLATGVGAGGVAGLYVGQQVMLPSISMMPASPSSRQSGLGPATAFPGGADSASHTVRRTVPLRPRGPAVIVPVGVVLPCGVELALVSELIGLEDMIFSGGEVFRMGIGIG